MVEQPVYDVSVVVPVYGGEATIEELVRGVLDACAAASLTAEVILVCDRPRDGSWQVGRRLAEATPHVTAVLLRRNYGQHPATLLGIRLARGRTIVTMDEDLQHSPLDVPQLVAASSEIGGIAYGNAAALQHEPWRNLSSRTAKWLLANYLDFHVAQSLSAFRAFPAVLREAFANYEGERVAIDVLLSWSGAPTRVVVTDHAPRQGGKSGYTLKKLLNYLADLAVGYSTAPLRLASMLGLAAVGLAVLVGAYVLANYMIRGSAVPGFAFLAVSIAIFAGAQLTAIGLMGEYLGRLYVNSLRKPQYTIAEVASRKG